MNKIIYIFMFFGISSAHAMNGLPWTTIGEICWKGVEAYQAWQTAGKKATDTSFANEAKGLCPELLATELNKWACAQNQKIGHTDTQFSYTSDKAGRDDCTTFMGFEGWGAAVRKGLQTYCGGKTSYSSINKDNQMLEDKCTYEYHLGDNSYRFTLTATRL